MAWSLRVFPSMPWLISLVALQLLGVAYVARPGVRASRRLLAGSLAFMVPCAGLLLALLVRHGRGQGTAKPVAKRAAGRQRLSAGSVERLSHLAPLLDRLMSNDAPERLAALVAVSSAGGAVAVAMLRWTLDHGPTEVALDAALALEELDVRRETRRAAAQLALDETPSCEHALALGDAAAEALLDRSADGPGRAAIAAPARAAYLTALAAGPARASEILERLAQLELAAGRPEAALAHLEQMGPARDAGLRDRAAFAARRFELLAISLPKDRAGTGTFPRADCRDGAAGG